MMGSNPHPSLADSLEPSTGVDGGDLLHLLRADGVLQDHGATLRPLTGGISSEIYLVSDGGRHFVVKRALPRLRTRDPWFADPSRNLNEQAYLKYVAGVLPDAVPAVIHASREHRYFAMEYLGEGFSTWKDELLAGRCDADHACRAARALGTIHAASRGDASLAAAFDTTAAFRALRIEPYLLTTARRHPALRQRIEAEAERLAATRQALVHGDFSPKNILVRAHPFRVVLLDCEVAWFGDPAFDLAFLLNHLLLKSLYHGLPSGAVFVAVARAVATAYLAELSDVAWAAEIAERAARLLPMLMLARVDGKSPVDYLTATHQTAIRRFTACSIQSPPANLEMLFCEWSAALMVAP